ncbi:hypothetical protein M0R19_04710 [Candidatus Pacearchaeota archaeon]|jgi:hypothetical protein|nr:hypothetical protein [Candidatus Pacearchaeota archaeon]
MTFPGPRPHKEPSPPFKDPNPDKSSKLQKVRLTKAGSILKEKVKKAKSNDKLLALRKSMFDTIGTNAGYHNKTEYNAGVSSIQESLHCIFGSLIKVARNNDWDISDFGHIPEEAHLIKKYLKEYVRDIPQYETNNDKKFIDNSYRVLKELNSLDTKIKSSDIVFDNHVNGYNVKRGMLLTTRAMRSIAEEIVRVPETSPLKSKAVNSNIEDLFSHLKQMKALD